MTASVTRRNAIIPIVGLATSATIGLATVPAQSAFARAANAYAVACTKRPDETDEAFGDRLDAAHEWLMACEISDKSDAARLLKLVRDRELTDAGDKIAFNKLIAYLAA